MRLLHVFSNWKWTGPAEPALHVAAAQARRGHDVTMAVGDAHGGDGHFHAQVQARGVQLFEGLQLTRHFEALKNIADVRSLARHLRAEGYDAIFCHMPNDHWIAGRAHARAGVAAPIVRTSYEPDGPLGGWRNGWSLRRATDFLVVASPAAVEGARRRFPALAGRTAMIEPGVDTERFDATRAPADRRSELGFEPDDFLIGLVARVQARREFDVFLEALARLRRVVPNAKALIVGTASPKDLEAIIGRPARDLGLQGAVLQLGRQRGEEYVALLAGLDVLTYLVPGSDGSCRAVREGLSMGLPIVATRRGMLPEIVEDGITGMLVDAGPESLAGALADLAGDARRRRELGAAGARRARERFGLERLGAAYERVLEQVLVAD